MLGFKWWAPRAAVIACCVLTGAATMPGSAGAAPTAPKWAVVRADGRLARGSGAVSSTRLEAGTYVVEFASDMTNCAYEATVGDAADGGVAFPIVAVVASESGTPNGVFVQTVEEFNGTPANVPFHLATYCDAAAAYAVVGGDGAVARGSHVVSTTRESVGRYDVIFDRNVGKCTFTATIGTTAAGQVFRPGTISVGGLFQNHKGVFVQTLSREGELTDFSFHLAVNCGSEPLTAVINLDGTASRGGHVLSAKELSGTGGKGAYEVIFDRKVTACAFTATPGSPVNLGAVDTPVIITTARRLHKSNGVFLAATMTTGAVEAPFHLTVTC